MLVHVKPEKTVFENADRPLEYCHILFEAYRALTGFTFNEQADGSAIFLVPDDRTADFCLVVEEGGNFTAYEQ